MTRKTVVITWNVFNVMAGDKGCKSYMYHVNKYITIKQSCKKNCKKLLHWLPQKIFKFFINKHVLIFK